MSDPLTPARLEEIRFSLDHNPIAVGRWPSPEEEAIADLDRDCRDLLAAYDARQQEIATLREGLRGLVERKAVSTREILLDQGACFAASLPGPKRLGHNPSYVRMADLAALLSPEGRHAEAAAPE